MRSKKRGQAWGYDLIAGISIFVIGIFVFFLYSLNYDSGGDKKLQELEYEAKVVGDSLLSEGFPSNFIDYNDYKTHVQSIGILSDGKVNETKLEYFYKMASDSYAVTKGKFDLKDNYWVSFGENIDFDGNGNLDTGIGKDYGSSYKNLIKDTRVVSYNNKIRVMNIYVWN